MAESFRVSFYNNKYTIIVKEEGGMEFLRHGEPWEAANGEYEHSKFILAAAQEIHELRDKVKELEEENKLIKHKVKRYENMLGITIRHENWWGIEKGDKNE